MVGPGVPGRHGGLTKAEACLAWGRRFHPPQGLLLAGPSPTAGGSAVGRPAASRAQRVVTAPSPHLLGHRAGPGPCLVSPCSCSQNGKPPHGSPGPPLPLWPASAGHPTPSSPPRRRLRSDVSFLQPLTACGCSACPWGGHCVSPVEHVGHGYTAALPAPTMVQAAQDSPPQSVLLQASVPVKCVLQSLITGPSARPTVGQREGRAWQRDLGAMLPSPAPGLLAPSCWATPPTRGQRGCQPVSHGSSMFGSASCSSGLHLLRSEEQGHTCDATWPGRSAQVFAQAQSRCCWEGAF